MHRAAACPPEARMKVQVQGTANDPYQYDLLDWTVVLRAQANLRENTKNDPLYERRSFCARDAESVVEDAAGRPGYRASELIAAAVHSLCNCTKDQATTTPYTRQI
ncbi:hypothetical protein MRX96_018068 [Rhipicephalus microplus]